MNFKSYVNSRGEWINFDPMDYREPPHDYLKPDWANTARVHDWKNYVNDELRSMWHMFSPTQKAAIARNAEDFADREDWE